MSSLSSSFVIIIFDHLSSSLFSLTSSIIMLYRRSVVDCLSSMIFVSCSLLCSQWRFGDADFFFDAFSPRTPDAVFLLANSRSARWWNVTASSSTTDESASSVCHPAATGVHANRGMWRCLLIVANLGISHTPSCRFCVAW